MDGDGVMVGANDAKFGKKRSLRSWRLAIRKTRRRRGGKGGGGDAPLRGGVAETMVSPWTRFLPEGRFMMSIPVPTFCASV